MKADLTRDTFSLDHHYARVIQQQGRVPLDADWNEQAEIQAHHDETETIDVIGPAGFPLGPSFQLSVSTDKTDVLIGNGTGYVGGMLAENTHHQCDVIAFPGAGQLQLRTLVLDGIALRVGEWLQPSDPTSPSTALPPVRIQGVDPTTQIITLATSPSFPANLTVSRIASYLIQPDWYAPGLATFAPPALPKLAGDGVYLAYLDVWRRHVTALEDAHLREVALGGVDTATRAKTVWQVKLQAIQQGAPVDCTTPLPTEPSTGRLSARARQPASGDSPCVIAPTARYRSLENQLYRVEIHDPGVLDTATYKFSRDNGMVLTSWLGSSGADLTVGSLGKDKVLGFAAGQWIELIDDSIEEAGTPGTLAKIANIDPETNTITIDTTTVYPVPSPTTRGYDITKYPLNPRIRRWDHVSATAALSVTRPAGDGYLDLEQGVQVRFEDGYYATGDYWLIPARTITADVEWPRNEVGTPLPRHRAGISHAFARLGIVTISGGLITGVSDCRAQFPPLTGLPSSGGGGCCCGVAISPTDDPQTIIDGAIAKAGTAKISGLTIEFAAGNFTLARPIEIAAPAGQGGHLVVKGCGSATRLVAPDFESVLRIVGWDSVTVTDLYVEAGVTGTGTGAKGRPDQEPPPLADINRHLLGTVYIRNCGTKRAERLELKCAAGPRRQAACLTMWDDAPPANAFGGDAIVERCRMHVGHMQVGVLIVNQLRATVTDNYVETFTPAQDQIVKITTSPSYLSLYRRLLAKDITISQPGIDHTAQPGFANLQFAVGHTRVLFRTDSALGHAWDQALKQIAPKAFHFLSTVRPVAAAPAASKRTLTKKAAAAKAAAAEEAKPAPAAKVGLHPILPTPAPTPKGTTRPLQKQMLKVRKRMNQLAYAVLNAAVDSNAKTTLTPAQLKPFQDWIAAQQGSFVAVASAGIVIAGQVGDDLRVTDNTVVGALDGIHLGFSHHVAAGAPADVAYRVQVIGNTIMVRVTSEITRGWHRGIFLGNTASAVVQRNRVATALLTRQPPQVDGISIIGLEGDSVIVSENHVTGATVGLRFWATPLDGSVKPLWLAIHNATFTCSTSIVASPGVIETGNSP
jgi:hypothetical protein